MDADAYFWIGSVLTTNGEKCGPGSHAMIALKIAEQRDRIRELEQQLTAARGREGRLLKLLRDIRPALACEDTFNPCTDLRERIDAAIKETASG